MADGSRTAASLVLDGSQCELARLMAKWGASEHGERSFQRSVGYIRHNSLGFVGTAQHEYSNLGFFSQSVFCKVVC